MTIITRTEPPTAVRIGPSVLSADFLNLGDQLDEIAGSGADYVHFDVMDGRFVPNISIGLPILETVRRGTTLPIDVHLMIVEPDRWIDRFADAGASSITVHAEATPHLHRTIGAIHDRGLRAGVAVNPGTSLDTVGEVQDVADSILIMTVNPGFGGQSFIAAMLDKIDRLASAIARSGMGTTVQVDGGINADTIRAVVDAGATSIVAGSALLNEQASIRDNIQALRSRLA